MQNESRVPGLSPLALLVAAAAAYPQEFSNRIGWEEMVRTVAAVYNGLPPEERGKAGIWGDKVAAIA